MATVVNDRDVLLLGTSQRNVNSQDATILITSDSPTFHVSATGTTTPSYITVTAHLLNIIGTASFTAAGATITDNGNNTATVAWDGMTGSSAVITASVTANGSTFNASATLTKVVDGSAGQAGSNASWVEISTLGGQVFSRATATAAFSPTSIALNATPYGNSATAYQWQYWNGSAWTDISGATSATYYVNSGDFTTSRNYRVEATINGSVYLDEMTLVQVTGGTNSVSGFLTNQSITLAAAADGTVGSYASATGTFKVYDGTTDKTGSAVTYSVVTQTNCTASIASTGVYNITAMTADTASVVLQAIYNGVTIPQTVTLAKSKTGAAGTPANQYAVTYLYQWSSSTPANPTGTSNYNWSTGANTGYVTNDGWSMSVPTNPGTPNLKLYVAVAQVVAASGTTSSTVSYSSASVQAWTQNGATGATGAAGVQSATATVFQWATSIPAGPSGTSTYTWSGGAIGTVPSGWSTTAGTSPSAGMTLWAAKVYITDSATVTQTSFNWTSASISAVGYAGTNGTNGTNGSTGAQGASYVTAYCASTTATTTTTPAQTTGKTSLPATNDGGITGTWSSTVPSLTSGQYLYQTDGIYDPTTNKVTWSIPYWSSLKVGSLSAITTNTGTLNVSGTISSANGNFTVDNNGGVTMKSATIQDGSGNIILQAGVPLSSQTGQVASGINSAATTATWSGVSGTGRPQDNATVGANASNLVVTMGGDNLVLNSSFESRDTSFRPLGYTAYNNAGISAVYVDVAGRLGGKAFGIKANASGATTFGMSSSSNLVDVNGISGGVQGGWQPNKTYTISFKAQKVNGSGFSTITLQWNTPPTTVTWVNRPTLSTAWQTYTARITFGASVEPSGQLYLDCNNGTVAANDEIHFDELIIQEGDVGSEWFASSRDAALAASQIASDNVLSRGEKPAANQQWTAIYNEQAGILSQATSLGVSSSDYTAKFNTLQSYINGLGSAFSDYTVDTPIVGATFSSNFSNYYLSKQALINALAAKAATMASGVTLGSDGTLNGAGGGQVTNLPIIDTRSVNNPPSAYGKCHIKEFKDQSVVGIPGGASSTYCVVETLKGWQDASGGQALQWAYITSGVVYKRSAANDATSWGAWVRDLDTNVYTGDLNATNGATLGTNVNGQITSSNSSTLVGTGAINSVHISDLRTTNYAEDGSGNPTAGGKLASTGTAFKVAANSMQIGTNVLSDYWFRLLQGVDGNQSNNRIIWRGNNDATTRGGAPNIACLSVIPKPAMADFTTNNLNGQWQGDASGRLTVYHSYVLTPTSYSGNTDNLDAMSQIHVQFFAKPNDLSPFIELYAACPSRTYDGATGAVRGTWALGFFFSGSSLANYGTHTASDPNLSGIAPNVVFDTNNGGGQYVYIGYLRIRIANSYGWSATQDFAPNGSRVSGSNVNSYQNNVALPTGTITGVAGSSGGGSGSQGGACPAPWVKVRLLNGKEINASDLHNGAKLAAVNDSTMEALPQGGTVRDLATIWAQRYRVKLTNGEATEWSENHRFAVVDRGWVQVQNLRAGDQIMGLKENVVESILAVGEGQVVSFRVEGAGTYFAGGLLCHNTKTIT
jgi:hypothetical protein